MSDLSERFERLRYLRQKAKEALSAESMPQTISDELWELIEQLEAENEELQRTRDETEALHRQFAELYEYAPVGYLVLNPKYLIVQANETARELLAPNDVLYGVTALGAFIYPDCQGEYFKALRGCREKGEPARAEICVEHGDDGFLWLLARIACDKGGEGEVFRYRVTLANITERVAAQRRAEERRLEAERLLEEKNLLLREIHHRVKNDFHLITSFLSLQGANSGHPEVKAAMDEARSRVSVMTQIYQALHRQSQYTQVDASTVVEEIVNGFRSGVTGQHIECSTRAETLSVSTGTSLSLGLILNELLTNAAKYAFEDAEEPALSVSLRSIDQEELELEVSDNGPGMPDAVVNEGSRGFGLSVAEAMAQQHRGSLTLKNDAGAVVRVRMRVS